MSAFVSGFSSATKPVSALEHATKWNEFDGDEVASTFIVPVFQYGPDIQCVRAHLPRDHNLTLRENEFFVEFDVQEAALFSEIGCLVETNFYRVSRCSTRERKYWNGLFCRFCVCAECGGKRHSHRPRENMYPGAVRFYWRENVRFYSKPGGGLVDF